MSTLDPTFRNYTPTQASSYASNRGTSYSHSLYDYIIRHHTLHSNGQFSSMVDVGCGTGKATRGLAIFFDNATGLDPGVEMVAEAARIGGATRSGSKIIYEVAGAEELEKAQTVKPGSVDLISSGMAAHWFNMNEFWPRAAKILKPGGTVALWTQSSLYCHPLLTPNAAKVQQILSHLEDDVLGPYELPSNHLSRTMYDGLTMPWDLDHPPVTAFARESCVRLEWNRNGKLEDGQEDFFGASHEVSLSALEKGLGTASMVTRWREANPGLVGTEEDCVRKTIKGIAEAMGAEGQDLGTVTLRTAGSTVLLSLTKQADES